MQKLNFFCQLEFQRTLKSIVHPEIVVTYSYIYKLLQCYNRLSFFTTCNKSFKIALMLDLKN